MTNPTSCAICQVEGRDRQSWFLLAENHWEDRLKILQWNDLLAGHDGMYAACSVFHVQQLVAHWMATGSLDYPFARSGATRKRPFSQGEWGRKAEATGPNLGGITQLGEIAVHRETLQRVLLENPESLLSILDALVSALDHTGYRQPVGELPEEQELAPCAQ
jgi:hypothetical protein